MDVFDSIDAVPATFGPVAVTIGKFDGVHSGHRAVLARLRAVAAERGLRSVVVTFDRNPMSLLNPAACPQPLLSKEQKLERLATTDVDAALVLTFDRALSEVSADDFVATVLAGALDTKVVLVGADFRFGARGAGDVALLRTLGNNHGFDVVVIDDIALEEGRRVSSTFVRELLSEGRVAEAGQLLTAPHSVRGVVVLGQQRGRELGYPTANLDRNSEGFIPADGVYAAWLVVDGVRFASAVSIGNNPTFDGVPEKQVEAHALDQDFDIYGKRVEIEFVEYVRGMVKYTTVDALIEQMCLDEIAVREILGVSAKKTPKK
ncbi:bifunctional riboflavin kinase/FAD synthetase [Salinibacterium sp. NSLL150]|uniref:bifunctional riboflavin kinase/FAD synthetase n=1 Tax=unclassified Salinibacterium TaxID=2632331 RepID=UPI0018CCEF26|nr:MULTISPECIES: bifunctional riboflavin kinase/FAD synthetase [unclassified Salinibacterium]MBH0100138.1 bifunctional riboflavin kinase/FAD synthetase [Salinibacterium sp. NSLL35]MBH0102892.1 bifunctional riboflavin kinase/FAD synthetase [Salinibacterium sp. NSLL150]MBH0105652.1 bifunctional riboflavin kinase/FAD synthetase [Salinibacterium sp. NSLL16]MBH0108412.1 bifunctional riboflavin kinase/FAD synthetase [Salinibacterium sp. NSLL17]MBH0111190.1 bifunctional riboflavin kinase/FAD syntheta